MSLKTLIVDDEPIARKVLREELESIEGTEVIGEADNGASALEQITGMKPDLVLLDLQMPELGGLDVIRSLGHGQHMPAIVIVTAYDRYALQAFEAGAIDYLLKPIGRERLAQAIERARRLNAGQAAEKLGQLQELLDTTKTPHPKKIVGRSERDYFLLNSDQVFAFQAEGDTVWIITAGERYIATQTLRVLAQRLENHGFRRIHRNALINVDHVRKMSTLSSQRWLITMSNGLEFIASKRLVRSIREVISR